MLAQDTIGKRFGRLEVTAVSGTDKHGHTVVVCKCDCGKETQVTPSNLRQGNKRSCGCLRKEMLTKRNKASGVNSRGCKSSNWTGYEGISGHYWSKIRLGAKRRSLSFDISIEYAWKVFLAQAGKCALTGCSLTLNTFNKGTSGTASLDRIDSSKGYEFGNIQWLHKDVNIAKQDKSDAEFISMCHAVAKLHPSRN